MMLSSLIYIALHLLSLAGAQSSSDTIIVTSLIFAPWDGSLSVITADGTATTYLENNSSNDSSCNAEAYDRATVVNGPSTAGITYVFTSCGTLPAYTYRVDCPLTEANTATCNFAVTRGNTTQTSLATQNSSELSGQPVTITAGIEKLIPASTTKASVSSATSGGVSSSTSSQGSQQTVANTSTSSAGSLSHAAQSSTSRSTAGVGLGSVAQVEKVFIVFVGVVLNSL